MLMALFSSHPTELDDWFMMTYFSLYATMLWGLFPDELICHIIISGGCKRQAAIAKNSVYRATTTKNTFGKTEIKTKIAIKIVENIVGETEIAKNRRLNGTQMAIDHRNSNIVHIIYLFPILTSSYCTIDVFRLNLCLKM